MGVVEQVHVNEAKRQKIDEAETLSSDLKGKQADAPAPNLQAHPGAAVYAASLDGLQLDDPVSAFFNFCKARESVRHKRERGDAAPWSEDTIFQRGRFLNVFREDDRVTKALFRFVKPLQEKKDVLAIIQAVFFSRWCNRDATLDSLSPELLSDSAALLQKLHALDGPWCNETAYPVEPVQWEGAEHDRLEAATSLFGEVAPWLLQAIQAADGDVQRATDAVNQRFGMKNDFPIFMAVMDLAWFCPELIKPDSLVPLGIGAVAFVDRLQKHLALSSHNEVFQRMIELQAEHWPEAKRAFQPIDIEYLCCECRKYYSYVNGTKTFEGKNVFTPGKSPKL